MRRFLPTVVGLLLAVVFVLPAQAQPADKPFPVNSIEARVALQARLQALGYRPSDAIESRAKLQKLAAALANSYSDTPTLEEIKHLLFLLADPKDLSAPLAAMAPDQAPLKMVAFARQLPRGPNPELQHIQKQTWPPDLTHGEKIALQTYTLESVPGLKVYGERFVKVSLARSRPSSLCSTSACSPPFARPSLSPHPSMFPAASSPKTHRPSRNS
jgi:hypothetical protein